MLQYDKIFEQSSSLIMLLSTDFIILNCSDAYLRATLTTRQNVKGRYLFTVFPDAPEDKEATGVKNLTYSLNYVLSNKTSHVMDVQKYDVPSPEGGPFVTRYWTPVNTPIFDDDGTTILYILHKVEEITDYVLLKETSTKQISRMEVVMYTRAQEIQKQKEELEKTNIQLQRARDEALRLSNLKSNIISNVSHELRTPLTGIIGYNELLSRTNLDEEQKNLNSLINSSSQVLLAIVNDILDVSKLSVGGISLDAKPMNIRKVVTSAIEMFQYMADEKEITLRLNIDDSIPNCVLGDARRISQVLYNLIGNGIKFTEKGFVSVYLYPSDTKDFFFDVVDTGIGISKENQALLFRPYEQLDISDTRKHMGVGLGLYISQQLVSLMQGQIQVSSEIGKGSTFSFSIRLPTCDGDEVVQTEIDGKQRNLEGLRVLIVDDNNLVQKLVQKQMKSLNMTFEVALDGKQAVESFIDSEQNGKAPYDIILMDVQMPVMDGLEATREIRQYNDHGKVIPIIAMTASIMQEEQQKCLESGMNDVLAKPFSLADSKRILSDWV